MSKNDKLKARVQTLDRIVSEMPDVVRVDYYRRVDIASAALGLLEPLWIEIDAKDKAHKVRDGHLHRANRLYGVVFAVGVGLQWLLSQGDKSDFGFGAWLMVGAAFFWVMHNWDQIRSSKELSRLKAHESDLLFHTHAVGANVGQYKNFKRTEREISESDCEDADAWNMKVEQAESNRQNAWISIKWEMLDRASGSCTFDFWLPDMLEPSDLNGNKT